MSEYEQVPKRQHHNNVTVAHRQPPQPKPKLPGEPYDPWAGKGSNGLATTHADTGHQVDRPASGRASHKGQDRKPVEPNGGSRAAIEPNRAFGEHIVGSTSSQTIHVPWNLGDQHASARFRISGAGFELLSPAGEVSMPPSGTMKADDFAYAEQCSPKIQFAPDRAGAYHGELSVEIRWRDGHVETKTVALHGRARTLEQAPAAYEPESQAAQSQPPQLNLKDPKARAIDRASSAAVEEKKALAVNAAGALADFQRTGVVTVKDEQATYQKAQAKIPRSILWDLAEVALTMGTAGVAGVVTKALLPKVIAQMAGKDEAQELGNFAAESIKEGIKVAGRAALQKTLPQEGPGSQSPAELEGETLSSNPRIEFFARQENVLVTQEESTKNMVATFAASLQPLVAKHPDQAATLLNALAQSFGAVSQEATKQQADATASQWVTAVARATLGTERVATSQSAPGAAPLTAVKTDPLRPTSNRGAPAPVAGVLDVYLDALVTEPKVVGAKLHGVAQEIADRLNKMELSNARLPIRFVVGPRDEKPIIITRDEAGRVLVQDAYQRLGSGEVQIVAAEALVHRMLSMPLRSWGVEIKSDDASGRK